MAIEHHSAAGAARYPRTVDGRNLRVLIIGAGSTAVQIVGAIADRFYSAIQQSNVSPVTGGIERIDAGLPAHPRWPAARTRCAGAGHRLSHRSLLADRLPRA